ncbi:amidohydrolase family protein [Acuticoccus sp. MNP-M23]|uniref:amidohydrolase family protein n=1 Tax=Acuticoccus sp. MNP-M23 TaxID=3072793 RepID=UPI0028158D16|nr:amidohydrolase family protein [Acuticoccus sp. MNP-M23]WMS41897.1 amidohydrolase family protein [Acuticoccus sp. MNP-M23]
MTTINRRTFIAGTAAGAALATTGGPGAAQAQATLIRRAYVMTMSAAGDRAETDVRIEDGRIAAIGEALPADGAEIIEADGHILLPGFVDTHTHLWLSQMRGLFSRSQETKYFPLVERLGRAYRPDDMRIGTLFGAAGNLDAGITTTLAYCDNIRSAADADAALDGLRQSGIRARFLYTGHDNLDPAAEIDLPHLADLIEAGEAGRVTLGIGWRSPAGDADDEVVARAMRELEFARENDLPISTHVSGSGAVAQLDRLIAMGVLADDMQLVHATGASEAQLRAVDEAGASVSLTPITEQRVGFGVTRVNDYRPVFGSIGLGIDGALGGAPDMFDVMKMLHNVQAGAAGEELAILPRRVLEFATAEGARSIGMGEHIGSIEVGKRADLQLIATDTLNMGPLNDDPSALLVYSAAPRNVVLVMVDDAIVKRDGRLTALAPAELAREAARSLQAIRKR